MRLLISIMLILVVTFSSRAQFAPPAGREGSTAIHADSSVFCAWATSVVVERGQLQIDNPSLGYADYGMDTDAIGKADNLVVSLGDGGTALCTFESPISNGRGPDFAVFENSLWDDFLELCFVEVSSDGIIFFRFDAISNVPDTSQVDGFGTINATLIHNFGGKYRTLYGTPFDLEELKNEPGLDVNNITHIKLIDVIGTLDSTYASYDSQGNPVNDPWPTPWNTSGFDLDAVGVIHNVVGVEEFQVSDQDVSIQFFPAEKMLDISIKNYSGPANLKIFDLSGRIMQHQDLGYTETKINLKSLNTGFYLVNVQFGKRSISKKIIVQ